jgi:hypothetical protein
MGVPPASLGPEMVAGQVGGDREQPGPDVGVPRQGPVGLPGPKEGFLGQVVGIADPACHPDKVAVNLSVVGFQDRLERLMAHDAL